ncbi:hypothetical protein, partial [Gottfriedia acidiceleris]|uniref:hypothetical protein n=1 Tax=Gottfriedia acidiceleris TaxID=371036 RepID=UPI002FFDB089
EILNDTKLNYVEKTLKILIQWTYDNIFYNRRTSLKHLVKLCEKYPGNTVEFKQEIEKYFTFTESVFVLDSVAQNPLEYNRWFALLIEKNNENINIEKLNELKFSLTRYLETYRFNTGLNFLSGMIRLLLDDFDQLDGFERLSSAFEQIKEMDQNESKEIITHTLKLGRFINSINREKLSEILCNQFPNNLIEIYDSLQDYTSLNQYLQKSITTIKKLGDSIDG